MPNNGPFPSTEAELDQYFKAAVAYLNTNATRLLVSTANKNSMASSYLKWTTNYPLTQNPDTATKTVNDLKRQANTDLQEVLRNIYNDIPESVLTSQDRNTLNLPVRSTTHTPAAVPSTKPVLTKVDTSQRLQHTIHFVDEKTTSSKAKPEGVRGCQIWHKIGGDAPKAAKELAYVATDTATPYVSHFEVEDAKQTVYYWLRWENTTGDTGPWSAEVKATVPE